MPAAGNLGPDLVWTKNGHCSRNVTLTGVTVSGEACFKIRLPNENIFKVDGTLNRIPLNMQQTALQRRTFTAALAAVGTPLSTRPTDLKGGLIRAFMQI